MITTRRPGILAVLVVAAMLLSIAAVACGSDDGAAASGDSSTSGSNRITDTPTIFTIDAFKDTPTIKTSKAYNVTGLPGATDAWKLIFDQKDFEVRFYPDHASAVSLGVEWADSVTGADAVVVGDQVLWEEGERDRRQCNRAAETPHSGCNYTARYGDYIILGNMILLCEGANSEQALKACREFVDAFQSS